MARAVHARRGREAFRQGLLRCGRPACDDAHSGLADRLQYEPGEEGRGAQELRRPARSEMGRQDRQGAPGLQRHDHERDVPDRARSRLGLSREARQAARHAGAVGDRHAQEDFAGRACGHGRRRGLPGHPLPRGGPAGRHRVPGGGHAARRRPERGVQGRPQSQRRPPVPELDALARGPAAHRRRRLPVFRTRPDRGEEGRAAAQGHQADERGSPKASRRPPRTSRSATRRSSRCDAEL